MRTETRGRRPRGTGSLYLRRDAAGRESWYCRYYVDGQQVKRAIGLRRLPGTRIGLTKPEAERELRRLVDATSTAARLERITFSEAALRYLDHLEGVGRKPTTLADYRSAVRVHFEPAFGDRQLAGISVQAVEAFRLAKAREGRSPKSIRNWLSLLNSIFAFGERKGWCDSNPVKKVDRPRLPESSEVRFLDQEELEAVLRAVPDDFLGALEAALYLTAAYTGLRQGELIGLRWRDVDWTASRLRVRRSRSRDGGWTTPKSRLGTRSVPLAPRVAADLERLCQRSSFDSHEDLVFAHPLLGTPLDRSKIRKRFHAALARAGVRRVRFHDLRHTFGTRVAAAGVPMRTLQAWMGHRDYKTTLIYADYAPGEHEAEVIERAFAHEVPAVADPVPGAPG